MQSTQKTDGGKCALAAHGGSFCGKYMRISDPFSGCMKRRLRVQLRVQLRVHVQHAEGAIAGGLLFSSTEPG